MTGNSQPQYVNYVFYKAEPAWHRLPREQRAAGLAEFAGVVHAWQQQCLVLPFSTVGTRGDTDFGLWRISNRLEDFTAMTTQLRRTGLGQWCATPYSYLGMTKRSLYVDHHEHPGSEAGAGASCRARANTSSFTRFGKRPTGINSRRPTGNG